MSSKIPGAGNPGIITKIKQLVNNIYSSTHLLNFPARYRTHSILFVLILLSVWDGGGSSFDRSLERETPISKAFLKILKKLKRRPAPVAPISKDLYKFRCRVCPNSNCILIKRGGKTKIRQICFEFSEEDNHTMWEDVTGIEGVES
jgi:hypothetical protein